MSDRGIRPDTDEQVEPTPEERAALQRYFTETADGRAALEQFFREAPDGQACMERHFNATPQGRALLREHFQDAPEGLARLQQHIHAQPDRERELREAMAAEIRSQQPRFLEALRGDTAVFASAVMQPAQPKNGLALLRQAVRLAWENEAFFCMLLYRIRMRLYVRGVPVLPMILHRLCNLLGQLELGSHVLIEPAVYIPHGKVVAAGMVRIGSGTMITPWVTLGLTTTIQGPTIGRDVLIGTGAKLLGPIVIGDRARIGANAVVLCDVPPDTTVAGVPATVVRTRRTETDPTAPPSSAG